MKSLAIAALGIVVLGTGCIRLNPLYGGPPYHFRDQAKDGTLNKKQDGTLDPQGTDAFAAGFRYELAEPGSLLVSVKPSNPSISLDISVYGDGKVPLATTEQQPEKKLTVQDLSPGTYYVVVHEPWRSGDQTRFTLNTIYKPADPDHATGAFKSQPGARELQADKGNVSDTVDYSGMRRTNWWKIPLNGEGALTIKFDPNGANLTAEFVPPQGAPEKIDPTVGLVKTDVQPGDYFVKVTANDAGDQGKYMLTTSFKQGDTCKNGGPACSIEGADELKLPSDSKTSDVDYGKAKQFHFYKLSIKEKGKLTINFKVLAPPRGSKIGAFLMKAQDDDGEKISGSAQTREIDTPGDLWIRVQAPEQGDYGKYALATIFAPNNFISGEVVEVGKSPCMLTVSAGTTQNVRAGAACTIVNSSGQAIDGCVVDQVFPNLSKVKPSSAGCRIPQGSKVQIAAQ
jgi:hypothetical protein